MLTSAVSSAKGTMPSSLSNLQTLSTVVPESTSRSAINCVTSCPTVSSDLSGESIRPRTWMASSQPSRGTPSLSLTLDSCRKVDNSRAYMTSVLSLMPSNSSGLAGSMPSTSKSSMSRSSMPNSAFRLWGGSHPPSDAISATAAAIGRDHARSRPMRPLVLPSKTQAMPTSTALSVLSGNSVSTAVWNERASLS